MYKKSFFCWSGEQTREPYCVRADSGNQVDDELCPAHTRPTTHRQPCTHTCPATWHYTDWSQVGMEIFRNIGEEVSGV